MNLRSFSCAVAATFVGSMLTLTAAVPVHSKTAVIVSGRHHVDPEGQRVAHHGVLNLSPSP